MTVENTYDPLKAVTSLDELGDKHMIEIIRHPEDYGVNWQTRERLIENVLCRDEDVANCAVDFDGGRVYVALTGDVYDVDELVVIDARLRERIGLVATHNFDFSIPILPTSLEENTDE